MFRSDASHSGAGTGNPVLTPTLLWKSELRRFLFFSSRKGETQPKVSFRDSLADGDFLTLTVWAGKSDPKAEAITVQIRHLNGDVWETIGRLAAYRTANGNYSQLPERRNRTTGTSDQKLEASTI